MNTAGRRCSQMNMNTQTPRRHHVRDAAILPRRPAPETPRAAPEKTRVLGRRPSCCMRSAVARWRHAAAADIVLSGATFFTHRIASTRGARRDAENRDSKRSPFIRRAWHMMFDASVGDVAGTSRRRDKQKSLMRKYARGAARRRQRQSAPTRWYARERHAMLMPRRAIRCCSFDATRAVVNPSSACCLYDAVMPCRPPRAVIMRECRAARKGDAQK